MNDWNLYQLDIDTAFLNASLNKLVFMRIPKNIANEECKKDKNFRSKKVCLVKRALYGLACSPKQWYRKFRGSIVNKLKFQIYKNQACIFYWSRPGRKECEETQIVIVLL